LWILGVHAGERCAGARTADFQAQFEGNLDDCFRIGISLTRKSVKLYAPFYTSDIIVASPLGLRMIVGTDGDKEREFDFLSSIEVCIVDEADTLHMQNWDHVTTVLGCLNNLPKQTRDTDFARVQDYYLNGWGKFYRQTVLISRYMNADLNTLFNRQCVNFEGRIKLRPAYDGVLSLVVPSIRQIFQRVTCASLATSADARFAYFTGTVLPQLQRQTTGGHTLIIVPSFFDYVRLRNYMRQQDIDFGSCCEYDKPNHVSRARSLFFQGRQPFMLVTERFHFFKRYTDGAWHAACTLRSGV
jgi:U3 small nucleolar RNA-associated protein 25